MLKHKPIRRPDEDLRDLPTYTIREAALSLGISPRTLGYWCAPNNQILKPAGRSGDIALLSFRDLAEAYVLTLLTKFYEFPLRSLRAIAADARKVTKLQRPLIDANLTVLFRNLIIEKPARGKHTRQMIDVSHGGTTVFPEFVDQLGRRVLKDAMRLPYRIYPWRVITPGDESRPVSMDPDVMSGRLVVTGTRIPVRILVGKHLSGRSVEEIAKSYQISADMVQKALLHIERPIHKKAA